MSGMGRGRPNKPELKYFPKMLDFYDDDKIFDLMDEYGPLGVTIYDVILTIVYQNGYYAELSKDKLSRMVIRKIGNKWIKNQKVVVQVIDYCAELGLLCNDLMRQNVITSEGIQKRYYKIAVKLMKRQLYSDRYWLLEKEESGEPVLNAPKNPISSEENRIGSEENRIDLEGIHTKRKETKIKEYIGAFSDQSLESAFQFYLIVRNQNWGEISEEQIQAMREELISMSDDAKEQIAIVKKATAGGWKNFYPIKKGRKKKEPVKKAADGGYIERDYDMDSLEVRLLKAQEGAVDGHADQESRPGKVV